MTAHCRTPGCYSTVPHNTHLVLGVRRYALRTTRSHATLLLPDGSIISRTQPGAVSALKRLVQERAKVPS